MPNYVPGVGSQSAKLMIVGEAPGAQEDFRGEPFVGPTGEEARKLIELAGGRWEDTWRTNVYKYQPPDNKIKLIPKEEIEKGKKELWLNEIQVVKPNAILALGNLALEALTGKSGILKFRGSILKSIENFPKVIPAIHPSAYLTERGPGSISYSAKTYTQLDFSRAVEESQFRELRLPQRTLQICKSSLDLYNFFRTYHGKRKLSIDIEVAKAVPTCIGLAFSKDHAISVPLINFGDGHMPNGELVECWKLLAKHLENPELQIIGQNFKFDHDKILKIIGIRLPNPFMDTMVLAHSIYPEWPKSLAFLTSVYTREPYYKDEYWEYNPKKDSFDTVLSYNCKDAAVTMEVFEELQKEAEEVNIWQYALDKMECHRIYMDMENEGFYVDKEVQKQLSDKYEALAKQAEKTLEDILGRPINIQSPKQLAIALYKDLQFPLREGTGEDILTALWANNCKNDSQRKFLSTILDGRKYKRTFKIVNSKPDYDGRMRTTYNYVGTETSRSSTGIQDSPVRPEKLGMSFHGITKHGDIGGDIRKMLIPEKGYVFLQADLSQAEPRIVALLSEDYNLLSEFGKIDIHRKTAGWFFELTEQEAQKLDKEDPKRFIGKTGRNGGNYDMGKRRLMLTINTDAKKFGIDVQVSEWKAGQILNIFHDRSPNIRSVFHRDVRLALESNSRTIITPYGGRRQFFDRWGDELIKEGFAHIPQRAIADHVKYAIRQIKKEYPGLRLIVEAHDAIVPMVRHDEVNDVSKLIRKHFESPIDFSECTVKRGTIVIPADFEIGENYKDFSKYKAA